MTLDGKAQSLLRQFGRSPASGGGRRRPPAGRRRLLLLASCLAGLALAPGALADTTTTPAPDPNPPPGAAPDPYTPAPKAPPKSSPAPVHTTPHVYSPPSYSRPAYTPPARTTPAQAVRPRAVTPARPTVVQHHVTRPVHKTRHRKHKRHVVVHHKKKPVVVRLTPRASAYVTSVVKTMSTAVAAPVDSDGGTMHRRRAAGLALFVLCAGSFGLVLLAARSRRSLPS